MIFEMSHSRSASSTILGIFLVILPHSLLIHITGDMNFGGNGVNSSKNISSLLEEFTAGMAHYLYTS